MSKYGELTALLDWATRRKEKEPVKIKSKKKEMTLKDYIKFQQEFDAFAKYMKEKEDEAKKLAKAKEQKKEGVNPIHLAMILVASFPITAPLYVYWMKYMLVDMWK